MGKAACRCRRRSCAYRRSSNKDLISDEVDWGCHHLKRFAGMPPEEEGASVKWEKKKICGVPEVYWYSQKKKSTASHNLSQVPTLASGPQKYPLLPTRQDLDADGDSRPLKTSLALVCERIRLRGGRHSLVSGSQLGYSCCR